MHMSLTVCIFTSTIWPGYSLVTTVPVANEDSLALPFADFKQVNTELSRRLDDVVDSDGSTTSLKSALDHHGLPNAYHNLLCVVLAEVARRSAWRDGVEHFISSCSNKCLRQVWRAWNTRFAQAGSST